MIGQILSTLGKRWCSWQVLKPNLLRWCIVKMKDGVEKVRLVVDMRRSGINGLIIIFDRVCLPRVHDVACSVDEFFKLSNDNDVLEFMVADFSDAFYPLKLLPDKRPWVVAKGRPGQYYCLKCTF